MLVPTASTTPLFKPESAATEVLKSKSALFSRFLLAAHLRINDKYDVKGRVHKLEQRKVWNVGLEHLPNPDSFDVEFSPSGQVLRKTTYNMAGAVSVQCIFFTTVLEKRPA
jgi:hypothetical protein